ncbi:MAG: helix-turn-helix transcriptional regulator [Devosia sp.]
MPDHDADREAIIALIHRNRIAIWTSDFDLWDTCFVHAPYTARWGWWRAGGIFVRQGWDDIAVRARAGGPPVNLRNAHDTTVENLTLRIDGNMAWAIFEQHYPERGMDDGLIGPGVIQEMRVFERHHGEWKIALLGFLDANAAPTGAVMVRVDPTGTVLWTSLAAEAFLADSDDLVIRSGRLRFRDRAADRQFEAALSWAAQRDTAFTSTHGAVPIVVDAGEGVASRIYWVIADAGMILLSLGNTMVGEDRLKVAALIYGLSPAQQRVSALVAEGLSLVEIAERLEVTPNTARTHLNRIFEKTGVRNQTALVRVLLSAVSPL